MNEATTSLTLTGTLLRHDREGYAALEPGPQLDGMLAVLMASPPSYAATGARLAAEFGRLEPARHVLHQLSQREFAPLIKDLGYVNALCNLSVVAIAIGDREQAAALYERLAPYPNYNTPNGPIGFFEGSASRFLAGLAAFLDRPQQAERHFDDALALNQALGALPQVARTCYEYARWLEGRGRSGELRPLQQQALALAERLGMRDLAERARAL